MLRCVINRALPNKAAITAESRGRHFIKGLYFTLQIWYILHNINVELNQKYFFCRGQLKGLFTHMHSHKKAVNGV